LWSFQQLLDGAAGAVVSAAPATIYGIIFNFTIRDCFTWSWNSISSKLIRVAPVIAVLATVNEPETELFVMVLYSTTPASLKSPSLL
jgi:putative flippase GtrA